MGWNSLRDLKTPLFKDLKDGVPHFPFLNNEVLKEDVMLCALQILKKNGQKLFSG